jgi:hypothetical protein
VIDVDTLTGSVLLAAEDPRHPDRIASDARQRIREIIARELKSHGRLIATMQADGAADTEQLDAAWSAVAEQRRRIEELEDAVGRLTPRTEFVPARIRGRA